MHRASCRRWLANACGCPLSADSDAAPSPGAMLPGYAERVHIRRFGTSDFRWAGRGVRRRAPGGETAPAGLGHLLMIYIPPGGRSSGAARQRALARSTPLLASVIICCRSRVTVLLSSIIIGDEPSTEQPPGASEEEGSERRMCSTFTLS